MHTFKLTLARKKVNNAGRTGWTYRNTDIQTTPWSKGKGQKNNQRSPKHYTEH